MKRRQFLKSFGALGSSIYIPAGITLGSLPTRAYAADIDYGSIGFSNAAMPRNGSNQVVMPQIINIFLYGGPSELAGNLTNIVDIEDNSQNSYRDKFNNDNFLENISTTNGQVTANGCWKDAGGTEMEQMLGSNDMSLYRTILKQKSPTRSHRESIFMSQKGSLDIELTPGVGTRLATFMREYRSQFEGLLLADGSTTGNLEDLILPFVSFEGESSAFALDPSNPLDIKLRANTLNEDFDNPYQRNRIFGNDTQFANANTVFDALVDKTAAALNYSARYSKASDGFTNRKDLVTEIGKLQTAATTTLPTGANYPNNTFGDRVKAAVTLALHNPSSLYITIGDGLGGWDDHNNGVDRYPDRMQNVMQTMQAAMAHINGFSAISRTTDNIVINIFGDFGRLVNLNGSNGWDHANNQNLYTFGGSGLPGRSMGQIVGETHRVGLSKDNNQYTMPIGLDMQGNGTANTPHFEPMAIAATTYRYFGAADTKPLTASPEMGEAGEDPITGLTT